MLPHKLWPAPTVCNVQQIKEPGGNCAVGARAELALREEPMSETLSES